MNKQEFIKKYDFASQDDFLITRYPEIKDCYSKEIYCAKGDHSDNIQTIDLVLFNDGRKYLCYSSSLADALFDQYDSNLMLKLLKVVNLLSDVGFCIKDENEYSEFDQCTYNLDKYYFCCATISRRINKYEDADINSFIRACSIFEALVDIIWETDDTSILDKYLEAK